MRGTNCVCPRGYRRYKDEEDKFVLPYNAFLMDDDVKDWEWRETIFALSVDGYVVV